jgi:hypothetical protein
VASLQDIEAIRGQSFHCVGNILFFIVEARGETKFIDNVIEFLVTADRADHLQVEYSLMSAHVNSKEKVGHSAVKHTCKPSRTAI